MVTVRVAASKVHCRRMAFCCSPLERNWNRGRKANIYMCKMSKRSFSKTQGIVIIISMIHHFIQRAEISLKRRSQKSVTGAIDCHIMTPTFRQCCLLQKYRCLLSEQGGLNICFYKYFQFIFCCFTLFILC